MTTQNDPNQNNAFLLIIFLLSLIALVFGYLSERSDKSKETIIQVQQIETKIDNIEKNINPYTYKDNLSKTEIIANFSNSSQDGIQTDTFSKAITANGRLDSGFIYIRASVDNKALTKNDDVYLKLRGIIDGQYQEFGGHLISARSLPVPSSENYTELLFDLSNVRYKTSFQESSVEAVSADWLQLLNNGESNILIGFTSTAQSGTIQEASFYYKCSGDSSNCLVTVK